MLWAERPSERLSQKSPPLVYWESFGESVRDHVRGFGVYHFDPPTSDLLPQPVVVDIHMPELGLES
ncbi:hypothetical protein BM1_10133 [Bipolaris maydis]|nr:hypothetical protein BM1_10133 [Bipolaris maydis]